MFEGMWINWIAHTKKNTLRYWLRNDLNYRITHDSISSVIVICIEVLCTKPCSGQKQKRLTFVVYSSGPVQLLCVHSVV